jgi:hypothetical protein
MNPVPKNPELLLSCSCGAVKLLLSGSPTACAYCHCASCRDLYGVPVFAATAWKNEVAQIVKGNDQLSEYRHPTKQMQRHFCVACGEVMFGVNRLGLIVVRNSLLARALGGSLPADFKPQFHLFYSYRELDIDDELPKYLEGRSGSLFSKHDSPMPIISVKQTGIGISVPASDIKC